MHIVSHIRHVPDAFFKTYTDKERLEYVLSDNVGVTTTVGSGKATERLHLYQILLKGSYTITYGLELQNGQKVATFIIAKEEVEVVTPKPKRRAAPRRKPVEGAPTLRSLTGMSEYDLMSMLAGVIRDVDGGPFQADVFNPHARAIIEKLDRVMLTEASSQGYDG